MERYSLSLRKDENPSTSSTPVEIHRNKQHIARDIGHAIASALKRMTVHVVLARSRKMAAIRFSQSRNVLSPGACGVRR